ncbi:MAG: hypothetical protein H6825_01350 [Planctomycetes bacterium]|nr:hypothetical protein [Planctomycetota bacterium]
MSSNLARNLYHLMRHSARRTSVDKLRRHGHKTVSVINFRDIEELIEKSVENTLRRKGLRLDGPDVHEEVRLEFLALMRERDILRETVDSLLAEQDELKRNRERIEHAMQETAQQLESEQGVALETQVEAAGLTELEDKVVQDLRAILAGVDPKLAEQAVAHVTQAIDAQRELAVERARADHEGRLDSLQRRMAKLKKKLAETEDMLERAREAGSVPEAIPGMPVEAGLKSEDPNFSRKKELLGEIFRLNVELREMLKKTS